MTFDTAAVRHGLSLIVFLKWIDYSVWILHMLFFKFYIHQSRKEAVVCYFHNKLFWEYISKKFKFKNYERETIDFRE